MSIILGIIFGILFAFHDKYVFLRSEYAYTNNQEKYVKYTRLWKGIKLGIVFKFGLCLLLTPIPNIFQLITFFCFYYVAFELTLNKARGLKWFYVTKDKRSSIWDNIRRQIFGEKAEFAEILIKSIIVVIGIILFKLG